MAFRVEIHSEWASPRRALTLPRAAGSQHPLALCPAPPPPPVVPTIQPGPPAVNASVNQTAVLPCRVDGAPPPFVSWRKDGAPLDPESPRWELGGEGLGGGGGL